jgi:DNA/RNA endonuclease YhcR with UshA esterase domain
MAASPVMATIADARAMALETRVVIEGQVTAPPGLFGKDTLYMQDATAGIRIYLRSGEIGTLAEGDWVRVTGKVDTYYGEFEIVVSQPSDIVVLRHEAPLKSTRIKTGAVNATNEGHLVQIDGKVTRFGSVFVDDGTGEAKVYVRESTGIKMPKLRKGQIVTVIGIVGRYQETWELLPRYASDIVPWPEYLPVVGGELGRKPARR